MKILKINRNKPQKKIINEAVKILKLGGAIVYPTDTCYGLGADITNPIAINKVYNIKGRNANKPLSMIIQNLDQIAGKVDIDKRKINFINKYLPGQVTFILLNMDYSFINQNTIGIRIPKNNITTLISKNINFPYTTTSANLTGNNVCYSIEEIVEQFKNNIHKPDLILDAGKLRKNAPSTVIEIINWPPKTLRQGKINIENKNSL